MNLLTVCQPYADLIARKLKPVENRPWSTQKRGPLAIHAGLSRDWLGWNERGEGLAFGAIVAIAWLHDCKPLAEVTEIYPHLRGNEHVTGPFCLVLTSVFRLDKPIAFTGHQGIRDSFDCPPALARDYFDAYPSLRPRSSTAQQPRGRRR